MYRINDKVKIMDNKINSKFHGLNLNGFTGNIVGIIQDLDNEIYLKIKLDKKTLSCIDTDYKIKCIKKHEFYDTIIVSASKALKVF